MLYCCLCIRPSRPQLLLIVNLVICIYTPEYRSGLQHACKARVKCIPLLTMWHALYCMQVVQTAEAVFDAVQAKFSALSASLLPKLVCPVTYAHLALDA